MSVISENLEEVVDNPGKPAKGWPYLPGIDGLRAIAVMAVLLYHAELSWMQGGFLGVEVFFVISGYLITSLLLSEWDDKNSINLKAFWLRRARRLLPALFLLLIITLVFTEIFLPGEVAGIRGDTAAAFGYVTNWYLIFNQQSYFETVGRPSLLQHLWSLAVEEQFYVLWPVLFAVGMRYLRRGKMLGAIIAGIGLSSCLMWLLYNPAINPSRVYYGTDTRAAALLIGAALAFLWRPRHELEWHGRKTQLTSIMLNLLGVVAFGVIIAFFTLIDQYQLFLYQGGFAVLSLATAVLIAVVVHPLAHLGAGLLEWSVIRWIGTRSYGIYLWHWPVFMLSRPQLDVQLEGLPLYILRFSLTFALAELSYRLVESPIRQGGLGQLWQNYRSAQGVRKRKLGIGWIGSVTALSLFGLVIGIVAVGANAPEVPSYLSVGSLSVKSTTAPTTAAATITPMPTASLPPETTTSQFAVTTVVPTSTPVPTQTPAPPTATPIPVHTVTAFGDSVMISGSKELAKLYSDIDFDMEIGIHFPTALNKVRAHRDAGQLGPVVLIHLGNNGGFAASHFDDMMQILVGHKVIFVNLKVPRQWEGYNNRVLTEGVKRFPGTVLVDWYSASYTHPEFFWEDGFHLRLDGAKTYANLLAARIKQFTTTVPLLQ